VKKKQKNEFNFVVNERKDGDIFEIQFSHVEGSHTAANFVISRLMDRMLLFKVQ